MLENEAKGWHGSYSAAGRNSAEKFHVILHMDEIIYRKKEKKKIKGYFDEDNEDSKKNFEEIKERDIFTEPDVKEEKLKVLILRRKLREMCDPNNENGVPERYKYHQFRHRENSDFPKTFYGKSLPSSTKYNPKLEFIWKRTITGPKWDMVKGRENGFGSVPEKKVKEKESKSLGRKKNRKFFRGDEDDREKEERSNDFYIKHGDITKGLRLVPMDKQTERGELSSDLRIRTEKSFNPNYKTEIINSSKRAKTQGNISNKKSLGNISNFKKLNTKFSDNINYSPSNRGGSIQLIVPKLSTKNSKISKNSKNPDLSKYSKLSKTFTFPKDNHAIDFSKTLSRKQVNFINRDREAVRPFFRPNYNFVEPRCITMVSYGRKKTAPNKSKRIQGMDPNLFLDLNKALSKVNNHTEPKGPNFDLMVSRPKQKHLPSYMINMHDRAALYTITDKTLKMNNFSEVGFKKTESSFYPKKSFNKAINLNLLKNDKFLDENFIDLNKRLSSNGDMKKLMNFYTKNLDNIESNIYTNKFDSVTYKTVPKNKNIMPLKDEKLFEINFSEIDADI